MNRAGGTRSIPGWRRTFIRHLRNGRGEHVASQLTGVGRDRLALEKRRDPEFAEQCTDAKHRALKPLTW